MNSLLHRDTEDDDVEDAHRRGSYAKDREITLGTTMVIGIFFALAVFAAVFFGFGYSVGAKRAVINASSSPDGAGATGAFSAFKPAPGNPLASGKPATAISPPATAPTYAPAPVASTAAPRVIAPANTPTTIADTAPVLAPRPAAHPAVTEPSAPSVPAGAGSPVVQVAAVSHQEDADLLVSTLKRRGYNVGIRNEPQDRLLHVQIGPFPTRKDADAMRQKLLADGFNAIVK